MTRLLNNSGLTVHFRPADEAKGEAAPVLVVKGSFALASGAPCAPMPPERQRPIEGDAPHRDALGRSLRWPTDLASPKPHTDLLVIGAAHAPGGQPLPAWEAGFDCGPISRRISVFGPRYWTADGRPGTPTPVASVPLRWELAFGALDDPRNPYGKGVEPDPDGRVAMPQIERRGALLRNRSDRPEPANLAPVPPFFPQRQRFAGTRDTRWSLFRAPLPPLDFQPAFHNAAPIEQQAGNHPRGDEGLALFGLHPRQAELRTALPGVMPRAVAIGEGGHASEIPLALDTVIVLTEEEQLVLVWRGYVAEPPPDLLVTLDPLGAPRALADLAAPAVATLAGRADPGAAERAAAAEAAQAAAQAAETASVMAQIGTLLKDVPLPAPLRSMIGPQAEPLALAEALITHLEQEVARLRAAP